MGVGQTALLDIEGKIFGLDPVVGAVALHLRNGAVELLAQRLVLLAQADAVGLALVGRLCRCIAEDVAAASLPRLEELRQKQLVREDGTPADVL